jgi:hypothetical protein
MLLGDTLLSSRPRPHWQLPTPQSRPVRASHSGAPTYLVRRRLCDLKRLVARTVGLSMRSC